MSDHYTTLGVPFTATHAQLSSAYRARALVLHPDRLSAANRTGTAATASQPQQGEKTAGVEAFVQLQQAYQVLSNPESRQQYDAALKAGGLLARFSSSSSSSSGGSGSGAVLHCTEVDLEDCEYEEDTATYTYPCRCGEEYRMSESTLMETGLDLFPCVQCSLVLRVAFEFQPTTVESSGEVGASASGSVITESKSAAGASSSAAALDPNAMG
jgi:curved DNA-binding protein CbpA